MTILRVPSEFGTIEAAQNAATEGDTILLAAGTVEAPAIYYQPYSGITKAVHLKNEDETDPWGAKCQIETYMVNSQHAAYKSCLAYRLATIPQIPVLYVEGIGLRRAPGTSYTSESVLSLYNCTNLAGATLMLNRCTARSNANGYASTYVLYYHPAGTVRFRNCYLNNYSNSDEALHNDGGELHLEKTRVVLPPWSFINSSKPTLDTADYVGADTPDYGPAYGEWFAPYFMGDSLFRYSGTVYVNGVPSSEALTLFLMRKDTGAFVAETTCDAGSGYFSFDIVASEAQNEHIIVSMGAAGTRPLAHTPINPVLVV